MSLQMCLFMLYIQAASATKTIINPVVSCLHIQYMHAQSFCFSLSVQSHSKEQAYPCGAILKVRRILLSALHNCRRKQKENQEDLLKRVNEETLRQLRHNQDENNQGGSGGGRQVSEVVAYRSISDMPSTRDLAIQVCLLTLLIRFA